MLSNCTWLTGFKPPPPPPPHTHTHTHTHKVEVGILVSPCLSIFCFHGLTWEPFDLRTGNFTYGSKVKAARELWLKNVSKLYLRRQSLGKEIMGVFNPLV